MSKGKKSGWIYLPQELIKAPAWLELGGAAQSVYLLLCCRKQVTKAGRKGRQSMVITNNGKIEFPYLEAEAKYGIKTHRFSRALDELTGHGFITIGSEARANKIIALYGFSDRWKQYGTAAFQPEPREKLQQHGQGFKPGNDLWRQSKPQTAKKSRLPKRKRYHCQKQQRNDREPILVMRTFGSGEKRKIVYKWSGINWIPSQIA